MSFQPLPFAKRNKISFEKPTLDPSAPREPTYLVTNSDDSRHRGSNAVASTSSHSPRTTKSLPNRTGQRTRNRDSPNWSKSSIPIHGNYANYYAKRDGGQLTLLDPRLALCDPAWFRDKRVLDVGCNAGKVTIEIGQHFEARSVTGVDIDSQLIKQSERALDLAWSRQTPRAELLDKAAERHLISEAKSKLRPATPTKFDPRYFPLSMPRMFGFLPVPQDQLIEWVDQEELISDGTRDDQEDKRRGKRRKMDPPKEVRTFPTNIKFRTADWPVEGVEEDTRGYDTIVAFSVTKWIHLHTLNAGLLNFFTRCFNALLPGGRLILEPQPFSSYAPSARFVDELKANLQLMKEDGEFRGWRAEDGEFEKLLLEQIGFEKVDHLGEIGNQGFKRPIQIYTKSSGNRL